MFFRLKRVIKHQQGDVYTGLSPRLCHVFQARVCPPLRGQYEPGEQLQVRDKIQQEDREGMVLKEKRVEAGVDCFKTPRSQGGLEGKGPLVRGRLSANTTVKTITDALGMCDVTAIS